jgi:putative DNA methylase
VIGPYPKRLIEVDLPIARISAHARREKSIRHGHISTLHIWWARRPLAACRAVSLAALWPDPVDLTEWARQGEEVLAPRGAKPGEGVLIRPGRFLSEARDRMAHWAQIGLGRASAASAARLVAIQKNPKVLDDPSVLRTTLLDFIADFANWDNATEKEYLDTARSLVQAAHEALGGAPGTRPLVVDPFAGGGSIPLEALRVGADAFASDLNPVAVLLNKVVLDYIPRYGQGLADEVRKWGEWIKREAEKELAAYYPKDADGAVPIAYLWARTIRCAGPGCGAEVPLIRSLWLAKKAHRSVLLHLVPNV